MAPTAVLRCGQLVGNTGANPGLSRNCHQEANLHNATAERLEGGGEC